MAYLNEKHVQLQLIFKNLNGNCHLKNVMSVPFENCDLQPIILQLGMIIFNLFHL